MGLLKKGFENPTGSELMCIEWSFSVVYFGELPLHLAVGEMACGPTSLEF